MRRSIVVSRFYLIVSLFLISMIAGIGCSLSDQPILVTSEETEIVTQVAELVVSSNTPVPPTATNPPKPSPTAALTVTPEPTPTDMLSPTPLSITLPDELIGVWMAKKGFEDYCQQFTQNGEFFSGTPFHCSTVKTDPEVYGIYWFDDGLFHIQDIGGKEYSCPPGFVGKYKIMQTSEIEIQFVLVEDGCEGRPPEMRGVWERVQ